VLLGNLTPAWRSRAPGPCRVTGPPCLLILRLVFPLALTLSTLSMLVLAAHFLRRGDLLTCLTTLVVLGLLLFKRRRWVLRANQVALVLAAVLWSFTTNGLVRQRLAEGGPAGRLVVIMGSVIVVNVVAAMLLGNRKVVERYPGPEGRAPAPAPEPPPAEPADSEPPAN